MPACKTNIQLRKSSKIASRHNWLLKLLTAAKVQVTSLTAEMTSANGRVTSLTADLATANGRVTTTQASLDKANTDLAVAKTTNISLSAELTKVENS